MGANARWSFYQKHLDFGIHGLTGRGIGRYGTAGLPDSAIHADGTLDLVRSYQALATLEWHGPKLDVYLNGGGEYAGRTDDFDPISGKFVGYGSPSSLIKAATRKPFQERLQPQEPARPLDFFPVAWRIARLTLAWCSRERWASGIASTMVPRAASSGVRSFLT